MAALKLRYEIDTPQRLREHLHLVGGAGYFFFPAAAADPGAPVALELSFGAREQTASLRGSVWARPAAGGVWLELPRAASCLEHLSQDAPRASPRTGTDQLVLAEPRGLPALLCRLIDVGEGGARLTAAAGDVGETGHELRIALPEAGPGGVQLEAFGRVAWAGAGEVGVIWDRGDLASRAAVLRLLQLAEEEWEHARTAAHAPSCRCMRKPGAPSVLLLG